MTEGCTPNGMKSMNESLHSEPEQLLRQKTECQDVIDNICNAKSFTFSQLEDLIFSKKIKRPPRKPRHLRTSNNCTITNIQSYKEVTINGNGQTCDVAVEAITNLVEKMCIIEHNGLDEELTRIINNDTIENDQECSPKQSKKKKSRSHKKKSDQGILSEDIRGDGKDCTVKDGTRTEKLKNQNKNVEFLPYLPVKYVMDIFDGKLTDEQIYIKGPLRISQRSYKRAFLSTSNTEQDLLIDGLFDRNRALEGDVVVAVVKPKEEWVKFEDGSLQKTGRVVCIVEKVHSRKVIGTLQFKDKQIFLYPQDHRLPILTIKYKSLPSYMRKNLNSYVDHLFMATISKWESVYSAIGKITQVLGEKSDIQAHMNAVLIENNICVEPYAGTLLKDLPAEDYKPTSEDLKEREDWRKECVFTIDPATAVDLDDAVSCKPLENGNYMVAVHISDVTHFLKQFSDLDEKVAERATTVYLADKVYHMLPKQLCQVCSLLPGCDKLAFSVIWELTPQAIPVKHRFAKTVIHSCSQLSYDIVQKIIDNPKKKHKFKLFGNHSVTEVVQTVNNLHKIAVQMRERRFNSGALRIDQPKLYIEIDQTTKMPLSFKIEEIKESNRLIEEFMLLANMTVADHLYAKFPDTALLRSHKVPSPLFLQKILNSLKQCGVALDAGSAGALQKSINLYQTECEKEDQDSVKYKMMVVNAFCTKTLTRATYICSNSHLTMEHLRHYALNVTLYTHFTSPIRRYADCVVHRLLSASLQDTPMDPQWNSDLCTSIAKNCNIKKYTAKVAQDKSCELYFAYYLDIVGCMETTGIVMELKDTYMDLILCEVGLKISINYNDLKKDAKVKYHSNTSSLDIHWIKQNMTEVVSIFSMLELKICKHPDEMQIQGTILPP